MACAPTTQVCLVRAQRSEYSCAQRNKKRLGEEGWGEEDERDRGGEEGEMRESMDDGEDKEEGMGSSPGCSLLKGAEWETCWPLT